MENSLRESRESKRVDRKSERYVSNLDHRVGEWAYALNRPSGDIMAYEMHKRLVNLQRALPGRINFQKKIVPLLNKVSLLDQRTVFRRCSASTSRLMGDLLVLVVRTDTTRIAMPMRNNDHSALVCPNPPTGISAQRLSAAR